jgi:hypothetical protein
MLNKMQSLKKCLVEKISTTLFAFVFPCVFCLTLIIKYNGLMIVVVVGSWVGDGLCRLVEHYPIYLFQKPFWLGFSFQERGTLI